ncbi:MAG: hypothetical protein R2789_13275 [Microthrixaceae bacterium]
MIIGTDLRSTVSSGNIVAKAFTPRMICSPSRSSLETARVVGELREGTRCEFVTDVAARIPMWSISELMGVPPEDRQRFHLTRANAPSTIRDPGDRSDSRDLLGRLGGALRVCDRDGSPRAGEPFSDSLTSMLLEAEVDGRKLNDMEYTPFFMFLIVAGNETTRTATSHGLLSLLEHRDYRSAGR